MKEEDVIKEVDKWQRAIIEIGAIKSPTLQATTFITKLSRFVKDIWQDGHDQGFEEGKKAWAKSLNKN